MAAIRLLYNCESEIHLIERFSLYLDLYKIIEQDKDNHSMNNVNIWFTMDSYYTVICYH